MHAAAESGTVAMDPAAVARARLRLAVRAERAWGAGAFLRRLPPALARGDVAPQSAMPGVQEPPRRAVAMDLFDGGAVQGPAGPGKPYFLEPPPERAKRIELLKGLDESEVRACDRCELCRQRTNTVFGEGDPEAALMFIGEGPGETEDRTGRPFVGRAGELLEKMIAGMGLKRQQVYIANVVKCRPPNNRVPTAQEVATCTPYLHKQIEWIRPKVIVTLGLPATRHLLKTTASMGALRGRWNQWRGIKVMPTYHPAFLLRSYTDENRRIVWDDLKQVMAELGLKGAAERARAKA